MLRTPLSRLEHDSNCLPTNWRLNEFYAAYLADHKRFNGFKDPDSATA